MKAHISQKIILETYIILQLSSIKLSLDASASLVCGGGMFQQMAVKSLWCPCSELACYCAVAVL